MVTSSRVLRGKLPSRLAMNSLSCSRWNSSWRYSSPSKENKEIKHQEVRSKKREEEERSREQIKRSRGG